MKKLLSILISMLMISTIGVANITADDFVADEMEATIEIDGQTYQFEKDGRFPFQDEQDSPYKYFFHLHIDEDLFNKIDETFKIKYKLSFADQERTISIMQDPYDNDWKTGDEDIGSNSIVHMEIHNNNSQGPQGPQGEIFNGHESLEKAIHIQASNGLDISFDGVENIDYNSNPDVKKDGQSVVVTSDSDDGTHVEMHCDNFNENNKSVNLFFRDQCSGNYILTIQAGGSQKECYIVVEPNQGGGNQDGMPGVFEFEDGDKKYILGFGDDSSGDILHINNEFHHDINEGNEGIIGSIVIGEADGNQYKSITTEKFQSLYDKFTDWKFEFVADEQQGENADGLSIVNPIETHEIFSVETMFLTFNVNRDTTTTAHLKTSFKYNSEPYEFMSKIVIEKIEQKSLEFDDLEKLNEALSDIKIFKNKTGIDEINDSVSIEIILKNGTYNGILEVNLPQDYHSLRLKGESPDGVILNGGINIKCGLNEIENINLVKSDSEKIDGKTIGISLNIPTSAIGNQRCDLSTVKNCKFDGFEYGAYSNGNGLISGFDNCKFKNCGVGVYSNSSQRNDYSDSVNNVFDNCGTGVEIVRLPDGVIPFQFVYKNSEFYHADGDYCDYKVDASGEFFFTGNYYGKSSSVGMTNNNVRSAKITYTNSANTKVYSNPCIRYPESTYKNGIDMSAGLFTAILYSKQGSQNIVNAADFSNLANDASMNICDPSDGKELAVITFKGAQ